MRHRLREMPDADFPVVSQLYLAGLAGLAPGPHPRQVCHTPVKSCPSAPTARGFAIFISMGQYVSSIRAPAMLRHFYLTIYTQLNIILKVFCIQNTPDSGAQRKEHRPR